MRRRTKSADLLGLCGLGLLGLGLCGLLAIASPAAAASHHPPHRQSNTGGIAIAGGSVYDVSVHDSAHFGTGCTLGFTVRTKAHRPAVLTAGHCVTGRGEKPTYDVFQTHSLSRSRTAPGAGLARIKAHQFQVGPKGDNAIGTLAEHAKARARVFVGGTNTAKTIPVRGQLNPSLGLAQLCYSGARTGEHCGFTITSAGTARTYLVDGRRVAIADEWRMSGPCTAKPGDSGSPIYQKVGGQARAVGILSAGGKTILVTNGTSTTTCFVDFTPLSLALSNYHATLMTSR